MTSRFLVGTENQGECGQHDYFVEIFERPDAALYVHCTQTTDPDGSTRCAVHYCPLEEAEDRPFFALARSIFQASQSRI